MIAGQKKQIYSLLMWMQTFSLCVVAAVFTCLSVWFDNGSEETKCPLSMLWGGLIRRMPDGIVFDGGS
jgi:hypothetical protein